MDSNRTVPESQVSVATPISETDEATELQEEMEQLKQLMTELKHSISFAETVTHFIYSNLIIIIILNIIVITTSVSKPHVGLSRTFGFTF